MPYVPKKTTDSTIVLPQDILKHLAGAGENDLKVLIRIYSDFSETEFDESDTASLAESLSLEPGQVSSAIAFWRGAGIIKIAGKDTKKKKQPIPEKIPVSPASSPVYPASQVAQAIECVPGMKNLVEFCQRRTGKLFNPSQLSTLYSFYDNLGFEPEIIMLAVEYCCVIEKKSLGYIEKVLISLSDSGISGYENAEEYFKNQLEYRTKEGKLRKLCGFTSRELSPSEKKIIGVWFKEWNIDFSLIEKAYEITVDRISKPSLKYMNSILNDWHQKDIKQLSDLEQQKPPQSDGLIEKSHCAEDFFKAAIAKSMGE
ncbi:MAG: DnaD domain protein [Clostridia bacterium]|nr:DnaD domain protein [Clostridia bacterium]